MNKHGGYFGEKKDEVLDFSININPIGFPNDIYEVIMRNIKNIVRYPEINGKTAREILAKHLSLAPEQLIMGNGASELIYLFARSIKPERVLIVQPTFNEYERAFRLEGCDIQYFITDKNNDFKIDINKLINTIDTIKPNVVVLCNPNNPTGIYTDIEKVHILLDKMKDLSGHIFVDESFIDFTFKKSLVTFIDKYPIFILRSMTKIYGIPGIRLGYGIGSANIIEMLNKIKEPWTMNSMALELVQPLLEKKDFIVNTNKIVQKEKEYLCSELKKISSLEVFCDQGNFMLCRLKSSDVKLLKKKLLKRNIYIRTCEDFIGLDNSYFRMAIKLHEENEKLVDALKIILEEE